MAIIRHLRHAPITEAVIDFRVALPTEFHPEQLREAQARLAKEYPKSEERKGFRGTFEVREGQPSQGVQDLGFQGVWLKSADEKTIAQFRGDGFTLNRLKPYTPWQDLLPEAMRVWRIYVDLAKPQRVTRLALRYINHMALPHPDVVLKDYILTEPRLAPSVPGKYSGFATRVHLLHPDRKMAANVMQALEIGVESAAPTLLFDIDVFRSGDFEVKSAALEPVFRELHTYKNEIFFGSLTERFVEVFA